MARLARVAFAANEIKQIGLVPISYHLDRPLAMPTLANVFLTSRCDGRCRMCDFWRPEHAIAGELTRQEWSRVFEELKAFGVKVVSVSAEGEVLTRPDVFEILNHLRAIGLPYSVNSNLLSLSADRAKELVAAEPLSVMASIDATTDRGYAAIRGVRGGLSRVLEAIGHLHDLGYHAVSIGAVCMTQNVGDLVGIAELGRRLGVRGVRYTALQQDGFAKGRDPRVQAAYRDPAFIRNLKAEIERLVAFRRAHGVVSNTEAYLRRIPESYLSDRYLPVPCVQGYYRVKVHSDGRVSLCPIMLEQAVIGNIRERPIRELWVSDRAREVRQAIRMGKCPGCWLSCYGEDNLRFSLRFGLGANLNLLRRAAERP